jgi:hypothetical protein
MRFNSKARNRPMNKVATVVLGTLSGLGAITAANANTTDDLGTVSAAHPPYMYSFTSTKPPASFTDYLDFDLSTTASIADLIFDYGVKSFAVQLQEKSGSTWTNVGGLSTVPFDNYGALSSGDYRLKYTGKTTGPSGTSSFLSGTFTVAAVPEPDSLALVLAGVGLLSVYQWRRRKSSEQSLSVSA